MPALLPQVTLSGTSGADICPLPAHRAPCVRALWSWCPSLPGQAGRHLGYMEGLGLRDSPDVPAAPELDSSMETLGRAGGTLSPQLGPSLTLKMERGGALLPTTMLASEELRIQPFKDC